jgi:hypothetical protein
VRRRPLSLSFRQSAAAGFATPGAGKVVRVKHSGEIEDVITGLIVPTGMTFGPDGALYISNFGAIPAEAAPVGSGRCLPVRLQQGGHLLVNQAYGLEGSNHYFELDNLALFIPREDVHAVDCNAVYDDLKFQHGIVRTNDLAHIAKRIVEENAECRGQVLKRDGLADLRRVHDGRKEDDVLGEKRMEPLGALGLDEFMPCGEGGRSHRRPHVIAATI